MSMASTYIPIIALLCYGFLLLTFLAAKKNQVIFAFLGLLIASMLWTGGAILMRSQMLPGYEFWFQVSITGLFLLPFLLYNFVHFFIQASGYRIRLIFGILVCATILLNYRGLIIKPPALSISPSGQGVFTYDIGWSGLIPAILTAGIILAMLVMIASNVRKHEFSARGLTPILLGGFILFLGNLIIMIPAFASSTLDTLSGIINAACIFYSLYQQRLFRLTLLVSKGVIYLLSGVFVTLLFLNLIPPLDRMLRAGSSIPVAYQSLIIAASFTLATMIVYQFMHRMFERVLIREEQAQAQLLTQFSQDVSRSLQLDEILKELIQVVKDGVKADRIFVLMKEKGTGQYSVVKSSSPLDRHEITLASENPCVSWFQTHETCLMIQDLKRTFWYKSMWESEKRLLTDLEIQCIIPLAGEHELAGMVLLGKKLKNCAYNMDDLNFLESIHSVSSIAVKNASLYEKVSLEARTDELTGLINRKYFHLNLDEQLQLHRDGALSLLILNIDDFKLYNQLYGNQEGDQALVQIARIIRTSVGELGIPARYSGKEFAVILPEFDVLSTIKLANRIREQVSHLNRSSDLGVLKQLTLSAGICNYPHAASQIDEIITNADMAVFHAKRSGKDKVEVYARNEPDLEAQSELIRIKPDVYAEYAATVHALTAAIDTKDHYTFHHSRNVAEYALILANAIGLNEEHMDMIREAALLHDIGKIGIPESILNKEERLTDEEYEIMKKHVENSISMIKHLPSLDYVIPGVIGHHERWDGKGYPRGIAKEDIPISARCLAIADAFDAMTTQRSYRSPLPIEVATQEIQRQAGTQFDPMLAGIFVKLIEKQQIQVDRGA